jgi:hypothetical protein
MMKGIPNFRDLEYSDLIDSIIKGKVCIFIGAGVSKLAGYKRFYGIEALRLLNPNMQGRRG